MMRDLLTFVGRELLALALLLLSGWLVWTYGLATLETDAYWFGVITPLAGYGAYRLYRARE